MENVETEIRPTTNGGKNQILMNEPYVASFEITGVAPILFHAWNCESVAEKSAAKKGSKQKKTDDLESYVYRDKDGFICLPGTYVIGSLIDKKAGAAKYLQDPRSPRKSALDLFKAGVVSLTILAPLGKKNWDFIHRARVTIQQAAITRERPAFDVGWKAEFRFQVLLPEYVSPQTLHEALIQAGRLVGVGDNRPTYGRFQVTRFEIEN